MGEWVGGLRHSQDSWRGGRVCECEHSTRGMRPQGLKLQGRYVPLTCTHVLDVSSHAHDQAPVRKTIDQLSTPALIFRSWYSRSDLALFHYCARAHIHTSAMLVRLGARKERMCAAGSGGVVSVLVLGCSLTEVGMGF